MIGFAIAAWRFIKSPIGLTILAVLAVIALLVFVEGRGHARGVRDEKAAQAERNEAARKASAKIDAATAKVGEVVGKKVETEVIRERVVTQTLIKEVPRYVTVHADAQCVVPLGFVRLHDAAATGVLPEPSYPAGQSADTASGLALSQVGSVTASNYGICREAFRQLDGWQAWWKGVEAEWPNKAAGSASERPK